MYKNSDHIKINVNMSKPSQKIPTFTKVPVTKMTKRKQTNDDSDITEFKNFFSWNRLALILFAFLLLSIQFFVFAEEIFFSA